MDDTVKALDHDQLPASHLDGFNVGDWKTEMLRKAHAERLILDGVRGRRNFGL
jgi:hypothetical protein